MTFHELATYILSEIKNIRRDPPSDDQLETLYNETRKTITKAQAIGMISRLEANVLCKMLALV
jgi:hypothetical protein